MADELVPIATFVNSAEAAAARCALEAQGIVSFLKDDNLVGMDWLLGNAVGYIKLVVATADAQRARALLDTPFDDWPGDISICPQCGEETGSGFTRCQHCGGRRQSDEIDAADMQAFSKQLTDAKGQAAERTANPYASPRSMADTEPPVEGVELAGNETDHRARCPSCGTPRVAVCPFCRTTGGHFRAAEDFRGEAPADEPEMLLCPTCDEPFDAVYFRLCGACGHDFGSGLNAPPIVREMPMEPLDWRAIAVGLCCVALVAGLIAYFAAILS